MSLSIFRFKRLFFLFAWEFALPIYANAISTEAPYCSGEQLAIYQIALDYPGMMHSKTLYGVINTSQKNCRLNGTPAAWGISKHNKIYLSKEAIQNGQTVLVEPTNKNYIASDKLVWFSIDGSGAVDGVPFTTIQIMLPGVANRVYTVQYNGNNAAGSPPSTLQKNAALWEALENDACPGFSGKVWPIYFAKTVYCG